MSLRCHTAHYLVKPGARRPMAGLHLVSRNHFRSAKVCVHVCVHPEAINNQWRDLNFI